MDTTGQENAKGKGKGQVETWSEERLIIASGGNESGRGQFPDCEQISDRHESSRGTEVVFCHLSTRWQAPFDWAQKQKAVRRCGYLKTCVHSNGERAVKEKGKKVAHQVTSHRKQRVSQSLRRARPG